MRNHEMVALVPFKNTATKATDICSTVASLHYHSWVSRASHAYGFAATYP